MITYTIDTIHNRYNVEVQRVPMLGLSPIWMRKEIFNTLNAALSQEGAKDLLKESGRTWGISMEYEGKAYAIAGYEGYIPFKTVLKNKELEYEIYKANEWYEGLITESVYSVEKKEMVTILKDNYTIE